ncbi:hypothetical protein ACFWDI_18120 [Streptomyces sp. NPDC060064]|uniref:hypothetical protein n=1 Tax=Streptomyces sp. NPDC060064 TaxID=3347049 RepID=UPI00369EF57F
MEYAAVSAELTASDDLPGLGASQGRLDRWSVREGANWLVTQVEAAIRVARIADGPDTVFAWQRSWPAPDPEEEHAYCSPVPGGGLAVSGRHRITVCDADGGVRWVYEHAAWSERNMGYGACTPDPSGSHLLATIAATVEPGRTYPGDLCVALDLATGKPLAETVLPSSSAMYEFQQSLAPQAEVFLTVGQGQDDAHSFLVALQKGMLHVTGVGIPDEPFTGNSIAADDFLKMAIAGDYLARYRPGSQAPVTAEAEAVLPDGLVFAGLPGFLDHHRILAAAAEDPWGEESRHFILDARTLRPLAELRYPMPVDLPPLPLGDGTWLTVAKDQVSRWQTEK